MFTFNTIGIAIMGTAFLIEILLLIKGTPEKGMIHDFKSNVLLGILYLSTILAMRGMALYVFAFCYQKAFFKPEISWWLWIAGFLGCDFINYFYHWLGHTKRLFWAAHVAHHSSEYFNFSTAFRNNFIHGFYRFLFWAPLCLFGIPPEMVLIFESINAIQNFLVHTEKIGKLGWLDLVFNTPSSHRVHHGVNPEYIDKNLGGMTLIFDHIFGTFAREVSKPVYGITHNIHTHSPYKIIFHEYAFIIRQLAGIKGFNKKLRYLFSPPN